MSKPQNHLPKLEAEVRALRERVATLKDTKRRLGERLHRQDEVIRRLRTERPAGSTPVKRARPDPFAHLTGTEYVRQVLDSKETRRVKPAQVRRFEEELKGASEDEVNALFPQDALLSNFVRNLWEWGH